MEPTMLFLLLKWLSEYGNEKKLSYDYLVNRNLLTILFTFNKSNSITATRITIDFIDLERVHYPKTAFYKILDKHIKEEQQ